MFQTGTLAYIVCYNLDKGRHDNVFIAFFSSVYVIMTFPFEIVKQLKIGSEYIEKFLSSIDPHFAYIHVVFCSKTRTRIRPLLAIESNQYVLLKEGRRALCAHVLIWQTGSRTMLRNDQLERVCAGWRLDQCINCTCSCILYEYIFIPQGEHCSPFKMRFQVFFSCHYTQKQRNLDLNSSICKWDFNLSFLNARAVFQSCISGTVYR